MRTLADLVDHVSSSRIELFERCPEAFNQRYVLGVKTPAGPQLAFGRAVDATANGVYFEKLQSRKTAPQKDVADRFAAWWDREADDVGRWDRQQQRGELLDSGVASVGRWRDRIAVHVQPVREPQVRIEFQVTSTDAARDAEVGVASTWTVIGVYDVVAEVPRLDGRGVETAIIDHKASGKTWHERDVARSTQPPVYMRATGVQVFQFHVLRTDLQRPRTDVARFVVPESSVLHTLRRFELARRAIARCYRSGDWQPHRNQILCSRRWCGHWRTCEQIHGGTVPA